MEFEYLNGKKIIRIMLEGKKMSIYHDCGYAEFIINDSI